MPVEVERDQGEVSVKVDIENATENKQEIVVPTTKEDVGNGISHGGNNGNGNEKEDTDGSYVFITENDTVESDSVKPIDANVEKDLKEGENMNSGELNTEVRSTAEDSQTLEDDGPEEVDGIPKSEIEDPLEKSVEEQHPGNGHLEIGNEGKLESTEEVEQGQDSEVGPRDLPKNNAEDPSYLQEKPEGKIESDSNTDVEGHQGDRIEVLEKSDLDVSEVLKHNEDAAKLPVDSDEGKESDLVSPKVSSADPNDGGMGLGQPTLTDPASTTINGSESVNDCIGSESVAVLEYVSVENGYPLIIESELEKIGDVPFTLEAEKVNASDGDVLPDSGPAEVAVSEVSRDIPAETQTLAGLDSHTSGKDGVVENGNSKSGSEAIQGMQSEIEAVDVSLSDGSMNTHPESQDASEPACDQDGKQHIASEVMEVLDVPASEERSDAVIVAKESVSEAASSDGLSCTNQQESERDEISGLVEKLPSHALHEDAPSGNDTSVNLIDETRSQSCSEDHGVDKNQNIQDDCSAQSEEVIDVNEKHAPIEKVQENNSEGNLNIGGEVSLNSAEEAKESPTEDLSGNVTHESAETISTNINGPSSLLDSKTAVFELAESSADGAAGETGVVATRSEAAQSVKESTEPHVVASTIEDGEINREVNCGSEVNVTKTTPFDVFKDTPSKEVSELEKSDIKDRSAINTDEEVDSNTKSFDSTKSPLVNNDIVKVSEEEDSREEKNETSGATASNASETKTCAQDLESKVVTSTDTIRTEAKDCVDSQTAENKGGNKLIENELRLCTSPVEDEMVGVDSISKLWFSGDATTEGSALDASEGHTVAAEIERRPFYFLPRVPRYDDERLAEKLKHAEAQVDQKTQSRDALRADIQKIRVRNAFEICHKAKHLVLNLALTIFVEIVISRQHVRTMISITRRPWQKRDLQEKQCIQNGRKLTSFSL